MKTVFFGTPEIAVSYLEFLCKNEIVAAAVTQTDKPSDRGHEIHKPPVKIYAEKNNIPVFQPAKLKEQDFISKISRCEAELGIAVAYGKIIPKEISELFPKGLYNIHFSLLPLYRGAAPIQWAIYNGDKKTGVTSFRIAESLDTGNIVIQKEIDISEDDDAVTLEKKLIPLGIETLDETLKEIKNGSAKEKPQTGEATYAPLIKKIDTKIDWNRSADEIHRQAKAFVQTGIFCRLPDQKFLKIFKAEVICTDGTDISPFTIFLRNGPAPEGAEKTTKNYEPGTVCGFEKNKGFLVQCKKEMLLFTQVQTEGKKKTDAWSFLQGHSLKIGDKLI